MGSVTPFVHLVVPGNPVPKARPRVGAHRNVYTPRRTLEAEARLLGYLKAAYPRLRPATGPCALAVTFYLKTDRRVDVDNLTKLVMDVGNRRIWLDDSQVSDVRVQKFTRAAVPRTEISVYVEDA